MLGRQGQIDAIILHAVYHFAWADQRLLQGDISYIALLRGQYLDIAQEGGFQLSFDPPFDLQCTSTILDLVAVTCGIEFTIF